MKVLIVFGTTEGHTRELAQFAARCLREAGCQVTTEEAPADGRHPDPGEYDATIVAASLHVAHYQPTVVAYGRNHHEQLNARPSAFISVSLSAAGENPDDWEGLEECLAHFQHETLWSTMAVHQAAGAIRYSQYDFFKKLALKHIARKRGQKTVTSKDYDLTDYAALKTFVLDFVSRGRAAG